MRHDYSTAKRKRFHKYRVRCRHCEHRRTTSVHPDQAVRAVRCTSCGKREWRIDWYRTAKLERKRTTCHCAGLPFPHRRGSSFLGHAHCL